MIPINLRVVLLANLCFVTACISRPVIIPSGYTKKYLDGEISFETQQQAIEDSFRKVQDASDIVLIEGTGHCAVGSIVNVNNATVASM